MTSAASASPPARTATLTARGSDGTEIQGAILSINRHSIAFEACTPPRYLRASEVLSDVHVAVDGTRIYAGRAVLNQLLAVGGSVVCEAHLESPWQFGDVTSWALDPHALRQRLREFEQDWEQRLRILPAFKALLADIHGYLTELRLWLDALELALDAVDSTRRPEVERLVRHEVCRQVHPVMTGLFNQFERVAAQVPPGDLSVHHAFFKRQLHPLILMSPFVERAFTKPLGYAGDYEMVNMILRDPGEGPTLYSRVVNAWYLAHPPAQAHRNRLQFLARRLQQESLRAGRSRRTLRVLSIGCGPAGEIQSFLTLPAHHDIDCTLIDFNEETLAYTRTTLARCLEGHRGHIQLTYLRKSVGHLLRQPRLTKEWAAHPFDLIYCAGLFDYLSDAVCREVMEWMYAIVAPGGLVLATNVDASNPSRHTLEYSMEWYLIQRTGAGLRRLAPADAPPDAVALTAETTGVNLFLEVRKPAPR